MWRVSTTNVLGCAAPVVCVLLRGREACPVVPLVDGEQEIAHAVPVFERMAERNVCVDFVSIAAANALPGHESGVFELMEDLLHCTDRDADGVCDVALSEFRVAVERDQHMRVVRQEGPRRHIGLRITQFHWIDRSHLDTSN